MAETKTVAERLREAVNGKTQFVGCKLLASIATGSSRCRKDANTCEECKGKNLEDLADMIEAEQAQAVLKALVDEVAKPENISIGLLCDIAKDLEEYAQMIEGAASEDLAHYAGLIRKAMDGAKPQLPEGIQWPRFEDGELVKFWDEFVAGEKVDTYEVVGITFHNNGEFSLTAPNGDPCCFYSPRFRNGKPVKRPEPEVFDADGVPIKVGDTLYNDKGTAFRVDRLKSLGNTIKLTCIKECAEFSLDPVTLTHRKPDTQEAIDDDLTLPPWEYCKRHGIEIESGSDEATTVEAMCKHLLERQRKLMGGE